MTTKHNNTNKVKYPGFIFGRKPITACNEAALFVF